MSRDRGTNSKFWTIVVVIFMIISMSEMLAVAGYAITNPAHIPLFLVLFVGLPIVSFVAWWFVGYRGRPVNPVSTHPLMDDPKHHGYQDYE